MINTHRANDLKPLLELQPSLIVPPWLSESSLTLLYARRGIGKTFLGLQLAISLATKTDFLKWTPAHQPRVLYIDGEMGARALAKRINGIAPTLLGSDAGYRRLEFITSDDFPNGQVPNISAPGAQAEYDMTIKDIEAKVVIIDNLLTCSAPLERRDDDTQQWLRIQPWLVNLRSRNIAVIVIHHAGKSGDQLGTSIRENVMDAVIQLKPTRLKSQFFGTCIEWHFTKTRDFHGRDTDPLFIEMVSQDDGMKFYFAPLEEAQKAAIIFQWHKLKSYPAVAGTLDLDLWLVRSVIEEYKATPTPFDEQEMF